MPAALLFALLLIQSDPEAPAAASAARAVDQAAVDARHETVGMAPTDDFGFVSWCNGAVDGWLELKAQVLPEVRRIESQFRRPGSSLAEDMRTYTVLERDSRSDRLLFKRALLAAEKASPRSLVEAGQAGYDRGRHVWTAPGGFSQARLAQEWMSWTLPARCETAARALETNAPLLGQALKGSEDALPPPAQTSPAEAAAPGPATPPTP